MLRDGLYSSFDRLPAGTSLGAALPRRVQVSVFEGGPTGALKASISFMVDASGGGLGCEVEPVLLLAERTYPGVFAPRLPPAQTLYTFHYRHYAQTNAYPHLQLRPSCARWWCRKIRKAATSSSLLMLAQARWCHDEKSSMSGSDSRLRIECVNLHLTR